MSIPPAPTSWISLGVYVLGVVFAFGIAVAASRETSAQSEHTAAALAAHAAADQTPVLAQRLAADERELDRYRAALATLTDAISRIDKNTVALCAANPRAQCAR